VTDEFPTLTLQLPAEYAGQRLDQALARLWPQFSRSRLQGWMAQGALEVDGRVPRPRDRVVGGERVLLRAQYETDSSVEPEPLALEVVHRDRALFVIDKPPGLVVHPGAGNRRGTMQNALLALDPQLARVPRAGIVHRLDKDTSGLLVVARTPEAHAALVEMLAAREIERSYLALCHGLLSGGGTIDARIGRHRSARTKMAVRPDGRDAVTHYRLERRYRAHTLLRVTLETGRTHQIRVHLAHIGFPIVGDPLYGGRRRYPAGASEALREALAGFPRQALHAARLAFAHPLTGRPLEFEAPLPADMRRLLEALERDAAADGTTEGATVARGRGRRK
jgi:23S rRNA pseudouridine1911/1915/1917 synthase